MKLQLCPTVVYALGIHKDVLSYKDLQVDSLIIPTNIMGCL